MLGCAVLLLPSCTKTCACENPNNEHKEIEVDPAESCSNFSDTTWTCS